MALQNGVVQRQADPEIPASGSETSLKSQSGEGLKGLSMGPNTTDLGKHSLRTAVSVKTLNCLVNMMMLFSGLIALLNQ